MKKLMAVSLLLLAACVDGRDDFTVDIQSPPVRTYAALSNLDGGVLPSVLGLPKPLRSKPGDGEVVWQLRSKDGSKEGKISFRIAPAGESRSRIHVDMDMPTVKAMIHGRLKELNEEKAERLMQGKLQRWAAAVEKGKSGSDELFVVNQVFGAMVLALSPDEMNDAIALAGDDEALSEFVSDHEWRQGGDSFASGDEAMSDPARDARSYLSGVDDPSRSATNPSSGALDPSAGAFDPSSGAFDPSGNDPAPDYAYGNPAY